LSAFILRFFFPAVFPPILGAEISNGTLHTVFPGRILSVLQTRSLNIMSVDTLTNTVTNTVLRAQSGDREAFGALVEQFYSRVYAIVMQRLRNTAEADEVTQEVFLRAFRKLSQLNEPAAFAGWLCQIAARLSINRAVRRPPETACEPSSFDVMQQSVDNPTYDLMKQEDADQLRDGLDRLGDMDRSTLMAFYFDGQSLKEMSVAFDSPIGTIKRRLHTARHRLHDVLSTTGIAG
jgi:RNA polymerase sigma-70 factor, ECF subfamily